MSEQRDDYARILRDNLPILDVRAPAEFSKGKLPNSINEPILTDQERHDVGITYKTQGASKAETLGLSLVSGSVKVQRIGNWQAFIQSNPDAVLTCWRGGKRSTIAQQWLKETGYSVPRLAGGFKAMRHLSLEVIDDVRERQWLVIAGQTGVGKTRFLESYTNVIDLEALANHRGSSFGRLTEPQPTPVTFEIALAQRLLRTSSQLPCLVEDESRTIGRLGLPSSVFEAMQNAPVIVLEAPMSSRLQLTLDCYVRDSSPSFLRDALNRIQKRLGGDRYRQISTLLENALASSSDEDHYLWIQNLLDYYYDPMYDHQLQKKQDRIVFHGNHEACATYLSETYGIESTV